MHLRTYEFGFFITMFMKIFEFINVSVNKRYNALKKPEDFTG